MAESKTSDTDFSFDLFVQNILFYIKEADLCLFPELLKLPIDESQNVTCNTEQVTQEKEKKIYIIIIFKLGSYSMEGQSSIGLPLLV